MCFTTPHRKTYRKEGINVARKDKIRIKRTKVKADAAEEKVTEPAPRFAGMQYENEVEEAARVAAEKRAARQKKPKLKKRLIILAVVVALVALIWIKWDVLNPSNVWTWLNMAITGGETGDGFPTEMEGSNVIAMKPVGNYLSLVTQNTLTVYNKSAGNVVSRTHSFSDPLVDTSGNRILLAEIGGRKVEIQTIGGKTRTLETEKDIVSAAVCDNGGVAVVTQSDKSHVSEVFYYNDKGEMKLHWYSSEAYLTGIALRDDGKQMAAIGVFAKDGAMQSRLLVFSTGSDNEPKRYDGAGMILIDVEYLSNDYIAAIGEDRVWVVKNGGEKPEELTFENRRLRSWAISGEHVGLVLQSFGSTDGGELVVTDKNAKQLYTVPFKETFRGISPAEKEFFLLCGTDVLTMDDKGTTKTTPVIQDALRVCCAFDGDAMVLGLTSIEKYDF